MSEKSLMELTSICRFLAKTRTERAARFQVHAAVALAVFHNSQLLTPASLSGSVSLFQLLHSVARRQRCVLEVLLLPRSHLEPASRAEKMMTGDFESSPCPSYLFPNRTEGGRSCSRSSCRLLVLHTAHDLTLVLRGSCRRCSSSVFFPSSTSKQRLERRGRKRRRRGWEGTPARRICLC